jgi:DNA-binding NtrC family response regulator
VDAAGLWNDLALARARGDDLRGAEKAFLHSARLLQGSQGPRRTTLALFNVAEIRLRQGRLLGVREILDESIERNLATGNWRGRVQDVELEVRLELVLGRPAVALEKIRSLQQESKRQETAWHSGVLHVLAARALGWLGRPEEAYEELEGSDAEARGELEPEELPALWALAGDRERALMENPSTRVGALWQELLSRGEADLDSWETLRALGSFRAARCAFDMEMALPGTVPLPLLRRAVVGLRRAGAVSLAERLEVRQSGPWVALGTYLQSKDSLSDRVSPLLEAAGYETCRLAWSDERCEVVLHHGLGGPEEIESPCGGGRLTLNAPQVDSTLKALFSLVLRDFDPARCAVAESGPPRQGRMIGECEELQQALARLNRLAASEVPLLIQGESGTGKELAAELVHRASPRSGRAFLPVNCAAFTEGVMASDLFGHVRGAFTGADKDRPGIFETVGGGTVFLDEVGDLPLAAQGNLLRVLQEGELRRVGESLPRKVDVRVVAATHRDLGAMVEEGRFRKDLFFRLKVGSVTLPPLAKRGNDILLLADAFLKQADGDRELRLTAEARSALLTYPWPGNVRELKNVLSIAVALTAGETIGAEDLELRYATESPLGGYHQQVDALRRRLVQEALTASGGNRAEAARRLGLSRQALSYLVKKLEIS